MLNSQFSLSHSLEKLWKLPPTIRSSRYIRNQIYTNIHSKEVSQPTYLCHAAGMGSIGGQRRKKLMGYAHGCSIRFDSCFLFPAAFCLLATGLCCVERVSELVSRCTQVSHKVDREIQLPFDRRDEWTALVRVS